SAAAVNIEPSRNTSANLSLEPLFVPMVTGLSTNVGRAGDTITLSGDNFGESDVPLHVYFNGTEALASDTTRNSSASITVKVPSGVTTGRVVVKADGVSSTSDAFFWVPGNLTVSSSKESWDPTSTSERLVMFGKTMQFTGTPSWVMKTGESPFSYGTAPSPAWDVSNPQAGTIDTTGLFTATRSYEVTEVSARLGSLQSATQSLTLVADAPVITGLSPTNAGPSSNVAGGAKSVVTINGSGFGNTDNSTLHVYVGTAEISPTGFTRLSDSQIRFTVPYNGVQTGQVKVVSYGVTSANKPLFQLIGDMTVSPSSFDPAITLSPGDTRQFTVSATDTDGNPIDSPNVTWSVTSTAVATISPTGLLTALDYGTCYPLVQSGAMARMGAGTRVDYTYNVGSGGGYGSNSVAGLGSDVYYAQSFTLTGSKTFKAVDAGIIPDGSTSLAMQICPDSGGLPNMSGALASFTSTYRSGLDPGHVFSFPSSVTLSAGTYHLVFKIPAGQSHYVYYFEGGGTGAALQSLDGGAIWTSITTLQPYHNPNSLFFRLAE
ncbi:MAG TPA: IPT/TIG domain-containing protein, partial [Stenomitos sp.]